MPFIVTKSVNTGLKLLGFKVEVKAQRYIATTVRNRIQSQVSRKLCSSLNDQFSSLNVVFFGTDQFSSHLLRGVANLRLQGVINRIQVITRSTKPCGRNLKQLKEPPIVQEVERLGIGSPIRCDTRDDMLKLRTITPVFDLILSVSFGKLIPQELIHDVKWALNVHPSLLPRYRGSSPIQYTLMNHDRYTGVSIQTLHPTKFDQGSIIAQTEPIDTNGLLKLGFISEYEDLVPIKVRILMDQLGIIGSRLLVDVIRKRSFCEKLPLSKYESSIAPKITSSMHRIHWSNALVSDVLGKHYGLGALYAFKTVLPKKKTVPVLRRVIFHDIQFCADTEHIGPSGAFVYDAANNRLLVKLCDGIIAVRSIQIEGYKPETAAKFMMSYRKRCGSLIEQQFC